MKKTITSALLATAVMLSISSCSKEEQPKKEEPKQTEYKCASCTTAPEALAANDALSKGVYKGIIIGSTGTIKFAVQNGTNDITATLVIDGKTVTLTSSVSWTAGQPYVAPFTGTMDGQPVSIVFSVQENGGSPMITSSNIPGHANAVFTLVKETSDALIECFEGKYSTTKPENGTFNIVLSRKLGKFGGIARENGTTDEDDISGTIDNGVIKDEKGRVLGNLNGDNITGSFQDSNGQTVTIEGKRTL